MLDMNRETQRGREPRQMSEPNLIERAKEGEDRAMDLLVRKHQPAVERRLRQLCRNEADVDDIAQEVMITLFRRLDKFQGKSSLDTWLYRVATNAFLMHERRRKRHRSAVVDKELPETARGVPPGWAIPGRRILFRTYMGRNCSRSFRRRSRACPRAIERSCTCGDSRS